MLKAQPGNVLISPLSAKILLTLLAEAAGQTVDSKTRRVSDTNMFAYCSDEIEDRLS